MLGWLLWLGSWAVAADWTVLGPDGAPTGRRIDPSAYFVAAPPGWAGGSGVVTDMAALASVAESTLAWLQTAPACSALGGGGVPGVLGLSAARTEATLAFIAQVAREDVGSDHPRLADPAFLEAHFAWWTWNPDVATARARGHSLPEGHIRVTRYLVSQVEGRRAPEGPYRFALYADPGAEARTRFSRPEIIAGAWSAGGAEPLVWLTESTVYEAQMQGTVEVRFPDGGTALFNVHQHNGRAYNGRIKNPAEQPRYWYFREVDGVYGFGWDAGCPAAGKVRLETQAAVAGDVWNLGLGRIVALQGKKGLHLAVLADIGGAFTPNLFQVDWYGGAYSSHKALYTATSDVPNTTPAGVLVLRSDDGFPPETP